MSVWGWFGYFFSAYRDAIRPLCAVMRDAHTPRIVFWGDHMGPPLHFIHFVPVGMHALGRPGVAPIPILALKN